MKDLALFLGGPKLKAGDLTPKPANRCRTDEALRRALNLLILIPQEEFSQNIAKIIWRCDYHAAHKRFHLLKKYGYIERVSFGRYRRTEKCVNTPIGSSTSSSSDSSE